MPMAGLPLKSAIVRASSVPSSTSATWPRRMMRAAAFGDDELLEVLRRLQPPLQADRALR